jgi:mono/diheme cytochrome c family protein
MKTHRRFFLLLVFLAAPFFVYEVLADVQAQSRGRYLVKMGGCNDCHTSGYLQSEGSVSEKYWLLGTSIGWRGPWGTTYPANLRLFFREMSEDAWLNIAPVVKARPPMPWWTLHGMTTADLRALYNFIKSLPVNRKPTPAYVPPDQEPKNPYYLLIAHPPKGQ